MTSEVYPIYLKISSSEFDMYGNNSLHQCFGLTPSRIESSENIQRIKNILDIPATSYLAFIPNQFGRLAVHYAVDRTLCSLIILRILYKHYKKMYPAFYSEVLCIRKDGESRNGRADLSIMNLSGLLKFKQMRDENGVNPYELAVKWGHNKDVKTLLLKLLLFVLQEERRIEILLANRDSIDKSVSLKILNGSNPSTSLKKSSLSSKTSTGPLSGNTDSKNASKYLEMTSSSPIIPALEQPIVSSSLLFIRRPDSDHNPRMDEGDDHQFSSDEADESEETLPPDGDSTMNSESLQKADRDSVETVKALLRRERFGPFFSPVVALSSSLLQYLGSPSTPSVSASSSAAVSAASSNSTSAASSSHSTSHLNRDPKETDRSTLQEAYLSPNPGLSGRPPLTQLSGHRRRSSLASTALNDFNDYPMSSEADRDRDRDSSHSQGSSVSLSAINPFRGSSHHPEREHSRHCLAGIGEGREEDELLQRSYSHSHSGPPTVTPRRSSLADSLQVLPSSLAASPESPILRRRVRGHSEDLTEGALSAEAFGFVGVNAGRGTGSGAGAGSVLGSGAGLTLLGRTRRGSSPKIGSVLVRDSGSAVASSPPKITSSSFSIHSQSQSQSQSQGQGQGQSQSNQRSEQWQDEDEGLSPALLLKASRSFRSHDRMLQSPRDAADGTVIQLSTHSRSDHGPERGSWAGPIRRSQLVVPLSSSSHSSSSGGENDGAQLARIEAEGPLGCSVHDKGEIVALEDAADY